MNFVQEYQVKAAPVDSRYVNDPVVVHLLKNHHKN